MGIAIVAVISSIIFYAIVGGIVRFIRKQDDIKSSVIAGGIAIVLELIFPLRSGLPTLVYVVITIICVLINMAKSNNKKTREDESKMDNEKELAALNPINLSEL